MRTLLALLLLPAALSAHDFWLEAGPKTGDAIPLRLHVGDRFVSEGEKAVLKKDTPRLTAWLGGDEIDLRAGLKDGAKPVASLSGKKAGTALVALDRAPRLITLEAAKFNAYLAEEGLTAILGERKKRGEAEADGKERYGRCLKLLTPVGGKGDDGWKRVVGQKLEVVPLADPTGLTKGDAFAVRVLFDGKPLAGVQVQAHARAGGKVTTQAGRTDAKGEASFNCGRGDWLVRLVQMRRTTGDADWESWWAALSFTVE